MERLKGENGFTLLELLVALTIFAIGLLSVAGMQVMAIQGNSSASTLSAATALADGVLGEILSWPVNSPQFADSPAPVDWDFDPGTAAVEPATLVGAGSYAADYSVTLNYNGTSNITRVVVTVRGVDPGNSARQVTVVGFKRMI